MTHGLPTRVAVTGGPGAGKTTALNQLNRMGYPIVTDAARSIIRERKAAGLSPRPEARAFARDIFDRDVVQYDSVANVEGLVFFDRTVVDSLGMLVEVDLVADQHCEELSKRYPYHPIAFIFPPWEDIYCNDSERDHTFDHAVRVYESIQRWYPRFGYECVDVFRTSVDERCEFMLRVLEEKA